MNSVIVEGKVDTGTEGDLSYSGVWRFCKDKKGFLDISYKKVSQEVSKELLDYISFLDPESLSLMNTTTTPVNKSHKKKKKKDSILPSSTSSHKDGGDDNLQPETEASYIDDKQGEEVNELEDFDIPSEPAEETIPEEDSPSLSSYSIDPIHPLMGLWEGEFVVKTATGEDKIKETLFFHSFLGSEVKPEFSGLPFEPGFPYLLLRSPEGFVRMNFIDAAVEKMKKAKESSSTAESNDLTATQVENVTPPQEQIDPTTSSTPSSEPLKIQTEGLSFSSSSFPPTPHPSDPISSSDGNVSSILGHPVELLEHLYTSVLYGFGKNPIGRFSVAAFFDPVTGELYCEKKYFLVKPVPKKLSKKPESLSISTSTTSLSSMATPLTPVASLLPSASLFEKLVLGKKALASVPLTPSESIGIMPRPRQIKPVVPFSDETETENTKKKRIEGRPSLPGSALSTPKQKNPLDTSLLPTPSQKEKAKLSTKNKELQQQRAMLQAAANPNALIGFRNPDNDDLATSGSNGLVYREAFLDADTGEIYEGEVLGSLRHGTGICIYSDGLMYQGQWHRGRESGSGILMTGNRQVIYEGEWLDGLCHGHGRYQCGNGDVYIGDFKEGYRHGKGQYIFSNGCTYSGDWKDNRRHGKGKFLWPDGSYYEGDWENDQRHGRGYLDLSNGLKLDSLWVRNVCEGKGFCTFPSGQTYQGTYKAGLRDGRGSVQFAEGATYEGRFREDRFDGYGTLKVPSVVPGADQDELLVPIQIQSDLLRIQWKAGFGASSH